MPHAQALTSGGGTTISCHLPTSVVAIVQMGRARRMEVAGRSIPRSFVLTSCPPGLGRARPVADNVTGATPIAIKQELGRFISRDHPDAQPGTMWALRGPRRPGSAAHAGAAYLSSSLLRRRDVMLMPMTPNTTR